MENYKKDPYRWVILCCIIPILAVIQVFWLTFSAISDTAVSYYHVSSFLIACLSMSYMIIYLLISIPASLLADKKGFRISLIIGAIITAVFGMLRGIFYYSFPLVIIAQLGIAVAQPFLVNPITKLAATWFPVNERATVTGIASMAGYLGMIVVMIATPQMTDSFSMEQILKLYGYISIVSALLLLLLIKEKPKSPAGPGGEILQDFTVKDLSAVVKNKNFTLLIIIMFIALGVFNALMTCINDMLTPRGISSDEAGLIGGIIILAGLVGALLIPTVSDKLGKRRAILIISMAFAFPGIAGLSFLGSATPLLIAAMVSGFFMMGVGPVAFQFGAEIAYPLPEGSSYGLLMMSGQLSGILFIVLLYALRPDSGSMAIPLIFLTLLMAICFLLTIWLKESTVVKDTLPKDGILKDTHIIS